MFTIGAIFWILYIVGLVVFGVGYYRDRSQSIINSLFWWVLIALLGFGAFGSPVK